MMQDLDIGFGSRLEVVYSEQLEHDTNKTRQLVFSALEMTGSVIVLGRNLN